MDQLSPRQTHERMVSITSHDNRYGAAKLTDLFAGRATATSVKPEDGYEL